MQVLLYASISVTTAQKTTDTGPLNQWETAKITPLKWLEDFCDSWLERSIIALVGKPHYKIDDDFLTQGFGFGGWG